MFRHLILVVLLFGSLNAYGDLLPPNERAEAFHAYLPYVAKTMPPVEAIVTRRGEIIGYPEIDYIDGYVTSLTSKPLYSVVLEIDVTIFAYDDPPPPPYTYKVQISPALTATLPGQVNPFHYSLMLGKASGIIGEVRAVEASTANPSGEVYYPLTVLGWDNINTSLFGTVRNDSSQTLQQARVVVFEPQQCSWREAELALTTLQPGEETTFSLTYPEVCLVESLVVLGQGAAQP